MEIGSERRGEKKSEMASADSNPFPLALSRGKDDDNGDDDSEMNSTKAMSFT